MKSLFALVTLVLAYFSIVSTITVSRVAAMERSVNHREEQVRSNERNIAVLLEKVTIIERPLREVRQELARPRSPQIR